MPQKAAAERSKMKLLALDSSGMVASVAVLTDGILTGEYTINYKKTHSQTLLPMVDTLVSMLEMDLVTIDAIAIAAGPGSFTGLRIGSATAKGLALALNKPIISVPTVDALAYNLFGAEGVVCPMMDARRSQVYTGLYHFEGEKLVTELAQTPMAVTELAEKLNERGSLVTLLGDGVPVSIEKLKPLLTVPYRIAPANVNRQRAASVGALGELYYRAGKVETAAEHKPEYLRLSQAEREYQEKMAKQAENNL
jgi:tRNA threonylcarbamoyladenosine biosynthesis protein TsaB